MTRERVGSYCLWLALAAIVAGCASQPMPPVPPVPPVSPVSPAGPVARQDERSRYGNSPFYKVHGRRYEVLRSGLGYRERGVASWYGKKFHGKLTSSREPYDMYAMTAAHKTLPIPTDVKVTNLANGKSVVVRINDRGPFVANRLIDLSYAAALQLGIVKSGTGLVEVTAIDGRKGTEAPPPTLTADTASAAPVSHNLYVQVGAFGDVNNARRRFALLKEGGIEPAFVQEDTAESPTLYRVRVGPIAGVVEYDSVVSQLKNLGISEMHLVTVHKPEEQDRTLPMNGK